MCRNIIADGYESTSDYFYHTEVSTYFRTYCECIDTLIKNLVDRFDQNNNILLSDVKEFFMHCLKLPTSINNKVHDAKLNKPGMILRQ